jgi:hypothetical protein
MSEVFKTWKRNLVEFDDSGNTLKCSVVFMLYNQVITFHQHQFSCYTKRQANDLKVKIYGISIYGTIIIEAITGAAFMSLMKAHV